MSFDDLIGPAVPRPPKKVKCEHTATCTKEHCMHKFEHYPHELGRAEQPEDSTYLENWDCTEMECSEGGCCE